MLALFFLFLLLSLWLLVHLRCPAQPLCGRPLWWTGPIGAVAGLAMWLALLDAPYSPIVTRSYEFGFLFVGLAGSVEVLCLGALAGLASAAALRRVAKNGLARFLVVLAFSLAVAQLLDLILRRMAPLDNRIALDSEAQFACAAIGGALAVILFPYQLVVLPPPQDWLDRAERFLVILVPMLLVAVARMAEWGELLARLGLLAR